MPQLFSASASELAVTTAKRLRLSKPQLPATLSNPTGANTPGTADEAAAAQARVQPGAFGAGVDGCDGADDGTTTTGTGVPALR